MSPIVHVERAAGGANSPSRWINQPSSSANSSEEESEKPSIVLRASTPSRYLRRRGLVPNRANLQISVTSKNSTMSSSSSTITSPTLADNTSTIIPKSSTVHQDIAYLPSLTESNLAKLMEQLELSGRSHRVNRSSDLSPQPAMEISYFSDGSSTHCASQSE